MSAFAALSPLFRALFALWALLLCLTAIGSAVLAAVRRRSRFTALALALFAPAYLLWQVIFDLRLFGVQSAARISAALGGLPWGFWLAVFAALTCAAGLLLLYNLRYDRSFITPGTIKLFLDKIPCGVCCWRSNGRVLFSNICMNRLCAALTGGPLLNGEQFRSAVAAGILPVEDKVWRFSSRTLSVDGQPLQEMVASDITAEYAKTRALERDRAELAQLNQEMRAYYLSIDDVTRRQEILQARVNIHDEMNRLMLSTVAADSKDLSALDRIFSLWERNALLLCMEADEAADEKASESLEKLASALGLRLTWQGAPPERFTEPQKSLFYSAAREAMANAVKHAAAKTMAISFDETETELCCRFTNDGETPAAPVCFTGGLANLSQLAARQGAGVSAQSDGAFTLTLTFPKNATNQPNG